VDLIFFLTGSAVTAVIAFLISKRSSKNLSKAIQNEALVSTSNTEDQLESLMDALDLLPIGVVVVDLKLGRKLRNNAAAAMTGVRYVDILVDQAVDEMLETIVTSKSSERILEAVAGTTRFFKIRGQAIDQQKVIVTVEDITEKSRIDTVQTDFVANLSHELKTPIGAVAALADSLNGETETEVVWRLAERIVTESHRMSRIVDDLLDLSRVEFGGTEEWSDVDLGSVLVEAVGTNQHAAKRQGLGLSLTGSAELLVRGDRSQLVSVISNLVDNAIKYSEAGGVVRVEGMIQGDEVVVTVTDHGIGIAERDQKRIFERFYRVDKARSRATGGTGLGLSIVRHIVLEHGGSIDVRSEEGIGSTFMVRLPRVTKQNKETVLDQTGAWA
jgi:two-component system, OmpR family, sensor histidine kinase SenX3